MSVIDTLLTDIEQAVRGTGERRRHALLRRTTATMIDRLPELSEHQLTVFDDVILSLALDVEIETRAELSEKLADLIRAPKKTIRALALDASIRVAQPVIERSPALDEETLSTIITQKDISFLSLLARRRALSASLMDQLIARGDEALLVDIARNEATPISDEALRLLAERALSHRTLYRVLRTRPDLATRHIGAVIEAARYRAKADAIIYDINDDMLSRALAIETAHSISKSTHMSLSASAGSSSHTQSATADLNTLLEHSQIDDALLALATEAGVSPDSVKRAFHAPQHEPLMFLLRAQDYPLATAMNFMRLKHGAMSHDFEMKLSDAYCALARDTAKRIAAFMTEKQNTSIPDSEMPEPLRHSA